MQEDVIVVRANGVILSTAGRLVAVFAFPWCIGILLAASAAIGDTRPALPMWLRLATIAVALAPVLAWWFSAWLARLPGFGWLLEWPQPRATLSQAGIELDLPRQMGLRFTWDEVTALAVSRNWRRRYGQGELRGQDGRSLAWLPAKLVYPKGGWWQSNTLAETIVLVRPDRYALVSADWSGRPDSVALRTSGAELSLSATKRRRSVLLASLMVLLVGIGAAGLVLVFARQP